MKRQWRVAFSLSILAAAFGALLWRTGSARQSSCPLSAALGKSFVPTLYSQCQQAHHNSSVGVVLLVAGLFGLVVSFVPSRADFRRWRAHAATMPAPAGWMRVPVGWRPVNGPFMPVPPGWPQPASDWVAPAGWEPPATWPPLPKGWPRPDSRSPTEVRLAMVAARAVYVIGLAVVGLDVAYPLPVHGAGAILLLWPVWIALVCCENLALSFRGLRTAKPYDVALFVGIWGCLYADAHADLGDGSSYAAAGALVLAALAFALALFLRRYRPSRATVLPTNLWLQPPVALRPAPTSDATIASAPDA